MADWDVVSEAPAGDDPWAVASTKPVGPQRLPTLDASQPFTDRALRAGLGVAQIGAAGIANIPHAAAAGAVDLYRRLTGGPVGAPMPAAVDAIQVPVGAAGREVMGTVAEGPEVQMAADAYRNAKRASEEAYPLANTVLDHTTAVAGDVAALAPVAAGANGVRRMVTGSPGAAAPEWAQAGFRNAADRGIARTLAGASGKDALVLHNQRIGNAVTGAEAGVPAGTPLTYESLALAREPANAVYNRVAAVLPPGPLDAAAMQRVAGAGSPTGLVTTSEAAQRQIQNIGTQLGQPMTGEQMVNNLRSLRQEGFRRVASEDVDQQMIGRAQLEMARAIEDHIGRNLPANGPVSIDQFLQARVALAKNHTVEAALRGNDVDLTAIARAQRHDPELLTGGLQTAAEFANANPPVTGLGSRIYDPPSFGHDLTNVGLTRPGTWVPPVTGAVARRALTGPTERLARRAGERYAQDPSRFDPLPTPPPAPPSPDVVPWQPPGGTPLGLADELGAGGAAAQPVPGAVSLADVLSVGVERPPAAGFSLAQELGAGGRPGEGIPFRRDAGFEAGGLEIGAPAGSPAPEALGDLAAAMSEGRKGARRTTPSGGTRVMQRDPKNLEATGADRELPRPEPTPGGEALDLPPRPGLDLADELTLAPEDAWFTAPREAAGDLPAVAAQGVPDGAVARTAPRGAARSAEMVDFPSGRSRARALENNGSGESAASKEAINRVAEERAAGVKRYAIDPDGNMTPITGVDGVDARAPKGSLVVKVGKDGKPEIVDRGGLPKAQADGLVQRALALGGPRLGDALLMPGG